MRSDRLVAVAFALVMVTSVVAGSVTFSSAPAAAASETTPSRFEVVDVGQKSGNLTVTIRATSDNAVKNFEFAYNDTSTKTTPGVTDLTTTDIYQARYDDGTPFKPGDTVTQNSGTNGEVTFYFNSTNTDYDYVQNAFTLNVTAYDGSYASADTGNRSMITANRYLVSGTDHAGDALGSVPLLLYDAGTNESHGYVFMQGGSASFHCRGIDVGGTCTNPDTDATSSVVAANTPPGRSVVAPGTVAAQTFSIADANASAKVDLVAGSNSLKADRPTAPVFTMTNSLVQGNPTPSVENVTVTEAATGTVVVKKTGMGKGTPIPPVLLEPNTRYTFSLENGSSFGEENRSVVVATKGSSGLMLRIGTGSPATSTVSGQIVDENGDPVSDAVVVGQPARASGSTTEVYNSTTTDANGLFSMTLPETDQLMNDLSFRVVGTDTSGGTPVYYPTTDANGGEGYVVQSGKTVLPPITLQKGGRVDINITSTDPQLPVRAAFSSLSQTSTAYPETTRTANSQTFAEIAFGSQRPSTASVAMLSPTTGSKTDVLYNVWGLSKTPADHVCAGNVAVSQGTDTATTCSLETAGALNLSVDQYGSVVQKGSSSPAMVGNPSFFFENELLVRDDTTGDVVTYLGPDGAQQFFLGGSGVNTTLPLPPGDYRLEVRPAHEFGQWTSVNDTQAVTVSAGSTADVTLDRGRAFEIRPVFDRMARSLRRAGDNTLAVRVVDPVTGAALSDTEVSVDVGLRYPNGTTAAERVPLTYNSTDQSFDTTTYTPSDYGLDAGAYEIALTASHAAGTRTYNATVSAPVEVSGFDSHVELDSRSVAPGESLRGLIKAYDGSTGIDANAADVDVSIYDQNGKLVTTKNPDSGITSGEGSFILTMPDEPGRYRIATRVTSTGGKQSISRRSVRVTQLDLSVETDKRTYAPGDSVVVVAEATDARDGSAVADATVTVRVNQKEVTAATDGNGRARVTLDPATYASASTWQRGHPVAVTVTQQTETGVVRKTDGTWFEVQAFDARAEPTARTFAPSENAKIDVFVPTDRTISSVTVTELDGSDVSIGGGKVSNPAPGLYRVDLGQRAAGTHVAEATVKTASGATQTAATQFAVKRYDVSASLNKRTFQSGETVDVTVGVRKTDGTAVSGQSVSVALNETGPVRKIDGASGTTNSDGTVSFSLNPSAGGGHFVEITVGDQERYLGLYVNDVSVHLEDGAGNEVDGYDVDAGTTETIHVEATSGGSAVTDGSNVTAAVVAFGDYRKLGNATTSGGTASIDVDVPDDVPAREYPLAVVVTTASGQGVVTGTLNITGANAKQIAAATNRSAYTPGDAAGFRATVTTGDGAPVANEKVDFILRSEGTADRRVATVTTNADGVATYDYDTTDDGTGEYVVEAALNDTSSIRAYSGYRLRSLDVDVEAADGPFEPGDAVSLTVYANDSATGNPVTATGGSLSLRLPGSNSEKTLSLSGQSPYDVSVTVPTDGEVTGTRSVSVTISKGRASDTASTLIDVRNASESANLSVAGPVTAGQSTTVTVNGTVDATATLTAFSPAADAVAYNGSVSVSSSGDTTTSITIGSPGTYVVKLSVPGVGTLSEVIDVQPSGTEPRVWTGTGLDANATTFSTGDSIYVMTNEPGMTATLVSGNTTYVVPLDSQDGSTYYGVLSTSPATGTYLVRLDSETATNLNSTIAEVRN